MYYSSKAGSTDAGAYPSTVMQDMRVRAQLDASVSERIRINYNCRGIALNIRVVVALYSTP